MSKTIPRPARLSLKLFPAALLAASALVVSPAFGAPEALKKNSDGIVLTTSTGMLRLQVWSDDIIRITFSPTNTFPASQSWSVISSPAKTRWTLKETSESVTLATAHVRAQADKQSGRVSFYDSDGPPVLREAARDVSLAVPAAESKTVRQSFELPDDEHIYGLGQHQSGVWDYRGTTVRLQQKNMEVAVPVLVSSKGYGLLWDNPSITDVAVGTGVGDTIPAAQLFTTNGQPGGLTGTYFNGTDFNTNAGTRIDAAIDFDWTGGAPFGLPHDQYSVRWEGSLQAGATGDYQLQVTSDDGVRLWVDGQKVIDAWNIHPAQLDVAKLHFEVGSRHAVRLEYFQGSYDARIKLGWQMPGTNAVTTWASEAGKAVDYYFMHGPRADDVVRDYRKLTGAAPLLPGWLWGYWQCKERYQSQAELTGIATAYRHRAIPLDGIIQDWQYWKPGYWGSHTFDAKRYPDPAALVKNLHDQGVHLLISVWPKFDLISTNNLAGLQKAGALYGPNFQNQKWYDPFNPEGRRVYWQQMSKELFQFGIDGWWLDASEPELGIKWGEYRDVQTAAGPGINVYNAYPLLHTTAVAEGQRAESSSKRVVILTRSAYAGQQRNSAITWSGDIQGNWDVFAKQIPAGLNFSLSGIPYWNTDIGGFLSRRPSDLDYQELFTRWFQFGAFNPMFRVHGTGANKEVWRWDEPTQAILEKFIRLRYRLLPYIYSVSWSVTSDGGTMMRPLVMDFGNDPKAQAIGDQFLFGPALMVSPITHAHATDRKVYLPGNPAISSSNVPGWYDFWTGRLEESFHEIAAAAPIETVPLHVPAGSILPLGPVVQFVGEKPADPIELRIYPGASGSFVLYEDEGDGYGYEKGRHATIPLDWNDTQKILTVGARNGSFPGMLKERTFRVVLVREGHGIGPEETAGPDAVLKYNGKTLTVPVENKK